MRSIWLITSKELRETLRDAHVLVFLLFPIVFYPLLIWGAVQTSLLEDGWRSEQGWTVDVQGPAELRDALLADPARPAEGGLDALRAGDLDVVVRTAEDGPHWTVTVHTVSSRAASKGAGEQVQRRLSRLRRDRLERLAAEHGLAAAELDPIDLDVEPLGEVDEALLRGLGGGLGALIPALMWIVGVYPAIGLVVGERDRGTMETTLLLPISRAQIAAGKLGAMVFLLLVSTAANLAALAITMAHVLALTETIDLTVPWGALLVVPGAVSAAVLITAMILLSVLPARDFKQGEMFASLAMTVGISVSVIGASASLSRDDAGMVWLPLGNLAGVGARALTGELDATWLVVPVLVNLALAGALLVVVARLTGAEHWRTDARLPAAIERLLRRGS